MACFFLEETVDRLVRFSVVTTLSRAHAEHGKRLQEGSTVTPRGKEQLPDQCRERAVDKEIIPFENRAQRRGSDDQPVALDIHLARIAHF